MTFVFSLFVSVTKLQNETHAVRQKADLKIARECWLDEERKLKEKLDKNEEENRSWLRDAFQHPDFLSIFHEIMPFAIRLDETGDEFRKTTLLPIVQLKSIENEEKTNFSKKFFFLSEKN